MISLEYEFDAELWRWPAKDTWFFITLPLADVAEEIKFFHQNRRGFGSLRVGHLRRQHMAHLNLSR